jgi:hypothetical protein
MLMTETKQPFSPLEASKLWLLGRNFDIFFIFGTAALSLLCTGLIFIDNHNVLVIAQLNVLLLATPHLVATYTRLCFDRASFKKHFFLNLPLPLLVFAAVAALAHSNGIWIIAAIYLYWQWWHYARQSFGISRMYLGRAHNNYTPHAVFDNYALYALPILGILYRSYQQPANYLGMPIRTFPVSLEVVWIAGIVTAVLFVLQIIHWTKAYRAGNLPLPYLFYIASHFTIFGVAYLLIRDINYGWLVSAVWHGLQYIVFVWMYNHRRLIAGEIPPRSPLGDMSRSETVWVYYIALIILAYALNMVVAVTASKVTDLYALLPWAVIISMSLNFHHYIVDAIIWKRRRRTVYA